MGETFETIPDDRSLTIYRYSLLFEMRYYHGICISD